MEKASRSRLKVVKLLLRDKKERDSGGLFAAEGFKIIRDMSAKGYLPEYVLMSGDFADDDEKKEFAAWLSGSGITVLGASKKEIEALSSLQNSQGILAVMKKKKQPAPAFLEEGKRLVVLCDGLQDPGNLGAIFRSAVAFGADAVILAGENVDPYSPKVVRASSGSMLDIPFYAFSDDLVSRLKSKGFSFLVSSVDASGSKDLRRIKDIPDKVIAAFGSEGQGVSSSILSLADSYFHIATDRRIESLNVTSAVSISLFTFTALQRKGA